MNIINIENVLNHVPHFDSFCTTEEINSLAESLKANSKFSVRVVGKSAGGVPIYHVTYGGGSVKALIVAGLHCMEPIGSLTAFSLLTLLDRGLADLIEADIEWHIVPCMDPDGVMLNEGWTTKPFDLESHMKGYYVQPYQWQADNLPISYGDFTFDNPSHEAVLLKQIIDEVVPDFYLSLHNARLGDRAFFLASREMKEEFQKSLFDLLSRNGVPIRSSRPTDHGEAQWTTGSFIIRSEISETFDHISAIAGTNAADRLLGLGMGSPEYLALLNPGALSFIPELPYITHPSLLSNRAVDESFRKLKLRLESEAKYIVASIVEEWNLVEGYLDSSSPFYRKIFHEVIAYKDIMHEGIPLPWSYEQTRELMFSSRYAGGLDEQKRFFAYMWSLYTPLCNGYCFVRLLEISPQVAAVQESKSRLTAIFDRSLADLRDSLDYEAAEVIDCSTLARVQLGSGLIALNSVLAAATETRAAIS